MMLAIFIVSLLAISAVSAEDNATSEVIASDVSDSMLQSTEIDFGIGATDDDAISIDGSEWFLDKVVFYEGDYDKIKHIDIDFVDNLENPENITLRLSDDNNPIENVELAILNDNDYKISKLTTDSNGISVYNIPFNVEKFSFCVGFWHDEDYLSNYANIGQTTIYSFNLGTWYNNNWNNNDENNIESEDDGTFTALQNKINNAEEGSTITLEKDYTYDEGFDKDGITIRKPLIINGNGHTIDGLNRSRIFNIENRYFVLNIIEPINISLNNVKFSNGNAVVGGAIGFIETNPDVTTIVVGGVEFVSKKMTHSINNCTFINNFADYGGAISSSGGILRNCTFINNFAEDGGAIGFSDGGSVINCTFVNNHASEKGGAIHKNDYGIYNFTKCKFLNNSAEDGAAISSSYCSCYIEDCMFYDNSANEGTIAHGNSAKNCIFANNSGRPNSGDAVNCTFINNSAYMGYTSGSINAGDAVDCSFIGNHVNSGAIMGVDSHAINCIFDNNFGRAIDRGSAVNCTFVNNYVVNNQHYGLIHDCSAVNCTFVNNSFKADSLSDKPNDIISFNIFGSYDKDIEKNKSIKIIDCNIQEDALNKYFAIEFYGNDLIVYAKGIKDNVVVKISGKTYVPYKYKKLFESDGYAYYDIYVNLTDLSTGIHSAQISYLDDSNQVSYDVMVPIYISPSTQISSLDVNKYYGGPEKYVVALTEKDNPLANVNVQITVNGKTSNVKTDSKGQASIDLNLPVGEHDVTATYEDVSTTSKVTVKSTLTTVDAVGTYLNSKVSATFLDVDGKDLASKQVTFKVGDKTYAATTNNKGVATADVDLGVGTYTVTAINPVNNEQKQFKLMIDKANSAIALASNQINGVITLTATLTPAAATGNVVFNVNGEDKTVAVKNGKATLTLSDLDPGDYAVTASYNGDKNLNVSSSNTVTFNVAEVYPILTADPVTKTYGTSTKLVVNLVDSKGNAIANADVSVVIGSATKHIKTDSNGQATMTISLKPATYTANITYLDAQTTAKINVKKATPKLTAKAKTFKKSLKTKKYTITLKTNTNKVMINTKVTLKVNGKTYKATTNSKGKATFKITKLTKKGKFNAVIKFAGNSYYKMVTKTIRITVKK